MDRHDEDKESVGRLLHSAYPVAAASYVTHEELREAIQGLEARLEVRLENAMLRTRNWVLAGVLATLLFFGSGFLALYSKIDRMGEMLPRVAAVQEGRRDWIQMQEQRDALQDSALQKLDPSYKPHPYMVPPE